MKQICQISRFSAVKSFSSLLLFAFAIYIVQGLIFIPKFNTKKEHEPRNSAVSATTDRGIRENIASREYHITYDSTRHCLQSPNRRHNLRTYYEPGKLTIKGRTQSADSQFKLELVTKAVYADSRILHLPLLQAKKRINGNILRVDHGGFKEEFINNEAGIRQNFIIEKAPSDIQHLQVCLAANGFQVKEDTDKSIRFEAQNPHTKEITTLIYHDLRCWDANKRPLTARMAYQDGLIALNVDVKNAAFPVTIDPLIINGNPGNAESTLQANQSEAWFGFAVSSAGDINADGYSDVVVGAPHYDLGQLDEGAAFVYFGSDTGLVQSATILQGNQANAQMGYAVASGGDINKDGYSDIIVGAPQYDKGQLNEGVAFVYYGSQKGLNAISSTILEQNQANARFGISIALAGDVNADGHSDLLVGADQYDDGQIDEGAAFLYYGSAGGVNIKNVTTFESNQANAMMGSAIASAGDLNADGFSDIMAGAKFYDKGEVDEGVVFIYKGSPAGASPVNPLILESDQADARMGNALAPAGDLNGDSYSDIAVGTYHFDNGQSNEGAVFIYHGSAVGATLSKTLEGQQMEAQMGVSVASAGDTDGDGYADLLVGVRNHEKGQANEGFVLVYRGSSTGIKVQPFAKFESNQAGAFLGSSCASAGDIDGDGFSDIIVGAYLYDDSQSNEGAVFVWHGSATGLDSAATTRLNNNQQMSGFGYSVSEAGDVNGDGFGDIIVGVPCYNTGYVLIYHGSPNGIENTPAIKIETTFPMSSLGFASSGGGDIDGDGYSDIIVSAHHYSNGENEEGAVYIYYGSPSGITEQGKVTIEGNKPDIQFGVSTSNNFDVNNDGYSDVVIGTNYAKVPGYPEGEAYVYLGSPTGINLASVVVLKGDQPGAFLGNSVAGAGDLNGDGFDEIIVGASNYDDGKGAAFIFNGGAAGVNTIASIILKCDQIKAEMGNSVSSAGDVNGDGYADVIVGSQLYDTNSNYPAIEKEGIATIYYGSPSGINAQTFSILKSPVKYWEQRFGHSVASAGDINGDGYSDVIIGADFMHLDEPFEGVAFIFNGSSAGISPTNSFFVNGGQAGAFLGSSVAGAGDTNGDGISDVVIGAPHFSFENGPIEAGKAIIYYGNDAGGVNNNLRLYNSDLTTVINHTQFPQPDFGAGLYAKSFLGSNKGKLVWETKPVGQGFSKGSNNLITNSVQSSGSQNLYTGLGLAGVELKSVIAKQGPATKVRTRVRYDPVLAMTGQIYGPWRYLPAYLQGNSTSPVPENAADSTAAHVKQIAAATALDDSESSTIIYPNPASDQLHVNVENPDVIQNIKLLASTGRTVYESRKHKEAIDVKGFPTGTYILWITHRDGSKTNRRVVIR